MQDRAAKTLRPTAWHRWPEVLCLLGVVLSFSLRLVQLGAQSLWYDETVSAYLASQSFPQLIRHTAGDIHPPGYYMLLHLWSALAGDSEYALAFFSAAFGTLIVALSCALAGKWLGRASRPWAALVAATSAFQVWYSQEVRMYTLAALIGMLTWWYAWRTLHGEKRAAWFYALAAAGGLYVLYYFVFLLIAIHLAVLLYTVSTRSRARDWLPNWILAQVLVIGLYAPWLPIAWRQATDPPVPPWRSFVPWHLALVETWSALSFGQSVQWEQVWPLLIIVSGLFALGAAVRPEALHQERYARSTGWDTRYFPGSSRNRGLGALGQGIWLAVIALGPIFLINLGSLLTPLYHVRYAFTYSPPFYMLVAAGLTRLMQQKRLAGAISVSALLLGTGFSFWQFHTHPAYVADDLRGAVRFIAARWRPGDAILINAGYAYPAFLYYYREPLAGRIRLDDFQSSDISISRYPLVLQTGIIGGSNSLGWGDAAADFYPTTETDTVAALTQVLRDFPRLWVLRVYDTVADEKGVVRRWLAENTIPFEDQIFSGPSYVRVQGFMSRTQPPPPPFQPVSLEGDITLRGWTCPSEVPMDSFLDVVLWWEITGEQPAHSPPYAVSLKLWDAQNQELIAQQDEWPLGSLLWTPAWPQGRTMRHPMRLYVPGQLSPGRYKLELQVYDSATVHPFGRKDGAGNALTLTWITVTNPMHTGLLGDPALQRYNSRAHKIVQ